MPQKKNPATFWPLFVLRSEMDLKAITCSLRANVNTRVLRLTSWRLAQRQLMRCWGAPPPHGLSPDLQIQLCICVLKPGGVPETADKVALLSY